MDLGFITKSQVVRLEYQGQKRTFRLAAPPAVQVGSQSLDQSMDRLTLAATASSSTKELVWSVGWDTVVILDDIKGPPVCNSRCIADNMS